MAEEGTLCINADVGKLAGENASATASAEAYTNFYIKKAEGVISSISRYDYVTNYSSLSTITKEILREAAASLAAIDVISYDMSGFTSRIEAEDMINILWAKWLKIMDLIKDQKFLTWAV